MKKNTYHALTMEQLRNIFEREIELQKESLATKRKRKPKPTKICQKSKVIK